MTGEIDGYGWIEVAKSSHIGLPAIVPRLGHYLSGLRAVNVSWDSGLLLPQDADVPERWTFDQGRAVSPIIDEAVLNSWPYSGGFDEWYFFAELPPNLTLSPYCNWGSTSLADWQSIARVPTGVDLGRQLRDSGARAVLGEGYTLFAISPDRQFISEVGRIARKVSRAR